MCRFIFLLNTPLCLLLLWKCSHQEEKILLCLPCRNCFLNSLWTQCNELICPSGFISYSLHSNWLYIPATVKGVQKKPQSFCLVRSYRSSEKEQSFKNWKTRTATDSGSPLKGWLFKVFFWTPFTYHTMYSTARRSDKILELE